MDNGKPGIGHCKHGDFDLGKGCPQCIAERESGVKALELSATKRDHGFVGVALHDAKKDEPLSVFVPGYEVDDSLAPPGDEMTEAAKPPPPTLATVKVAPERDAIVLKLLDEAMRIRKWAAELVVSTEEEAKLATTDLAVMGKLKKAVDEKRREYVDPLNKHVKAVNDTFKLLTEPLLAADQIARGKVTAYKVGQERQRREAEEINRQKMELARREAELKHGEITVDLTQVEVPATPKLTRTGVGTAGLVDNWKYEVVDFAALPDEYKVADHAMLSGIARKYHDAKKVSGVRFYNEPNLRVTESRG